MNPPHLCVQHATEDRFHQKVLSRQRCRAVVCNVLHASPEPDETVETETVEVESPRDSYGRQVPEGQTWAKAPPPLPPLLSRPHFGSAAAEAEGSALEEGSLPEPTSHVLLNHLFQRGDERVLSLAATFRHGERKYVTNVFYTPAARAGGDMVAAPVLENGGGGGGGETAPDLLGPRRPSEPNEC